MSRRRGSMATFDLEPGAPADHADHADHEDHDQDGADQRGPGEAFDDEPPTAGQRAVGRLRAVRPRTWLAVAGVVAGTLVMTGEGIFAVHWFAEQQRADLLTQAPGGVLDVAAAAEDGGWEVETDSEVLAVLSGGAVVVRDGADVLGLDAATGSELWRHTLGSQVECGPAPQDPAEWAMPGDEVVCLSGDLADRTVTVIGADGAVLGGRSLGDVTDLAVAPAAGGMVVVEPDGPLPEPREFSDSQEAFRVLESGALSGPGAVLRFEDALTGGVHASVALDFDPKATEYSCLTWMNDTPQIDFSGYSLRSSPGVVEYSRCGLAVTWAPPTAGSSMIPEVGRPDDGWWASAVRSVDGGVAVERSGLRSLLDDVPGDPDGVLLPGLLLDPMATDGTAGPRLVGTGAGIVALDPDDLGGEPRWERPWEPDVSTDPAELAHSTRVVVRTADVVLYQRPRGELVALDARTGDELWRDDAPVEGWMQYRWLAGAVTDGHQALLLVGDDGDAHTLVRLDLASGDVLAQVAREGALGWQPGTVDGRLLLRTDVTGSSVATDDDGLMITRSPGSLRGAGRA